MTRGAAILVVLALVAGLEAQSYDRRTFRIPQLPTAMYWEDLDGDGKKELLVEDKSAVHVYRPLSSDAPGRLFQSLADGRGFLYDLVDLDGDGSQELLVVKSRGVHVYRFTDGRFIGGDEPTLRVRRAYLPSRPQRVDMAADVNGDGKVDLVYPGGSRLLLFPGDGKGGFGRHRALPSGIRITVRAYSGHLDAQLESTFRIPKLVSRDVDGDGRPDLVSRPGNRLNVYRGLDDNRFAEEATWVLDLGKFEPSREEEASRNVRVQMARVNLSQDDLDGDGVADFLIAAGRKVWIFFGGRGFKGFGRPDRILRVREDIAAIFTADVDGDRRADLVLIKFEMPSMARMVAALLVGIDLRIVALAFKNRGDRTISKRPDRTNNIVFAVPPILGLLNDFEKLEKKVGTARDRARRLRVGDIDGDGIPDIGLRGDDGRIALYRCTGKGALAGGRQNRQVANRVIRDLLFDKRRRVWDFERLLDYAADLRYSLNREQLEGRKPVASVALRAGDAGTPDFGFQELNGDGRADIVVTYDAKGGRDVDLYLSKGK